MSNHPDRRGKSNATSTLLLLRFCIIVCIVPVHAVLYAVHSYLLLHGTFHRPSYSLYGPCPAPAPLSLPHLRSLLQHRVSPTMPTEDKSAATGKTGASPEPVKLEANTATSPGSPSKRELAFSTNGNENGNEEDAEEVDSEEDFLQHIEQEEAEKESTADNHQSSNAKDAPRLLQDALKKGDVEPDDSEEEEKKDAKEEEGDASAAHAVADKKKSVVADAIEGNAEEHVHQRVSQSATDLTLFFYGGFLTLHRIL